MPVYNGGRYLAPALRSVLGQSFRDFELIALNDGSTDGSGEVLDEYARLDPRIRVVHQPNRGLVPTLNTGLELASGTYIARMDADDVCMPSRFEKQVAFLDAFPDIAVVGTQMRLVNEGGRILGISESPLTPLRVQWTLLLNSALVHPTIMARRDILNRYGGYESGFPHTEDYALWTRLAIHEKLANLPDILLTYRYLGSGVSTKYQTIQVENSRKLVGRYAHELLGLDADPGTHLASAAIREKPLSAVTADELAHAADYVLWLYQQFQDRCPLSAGETTELREAVGEYLQPIVLALTVRRPQMGVRYGRMLSRLSPRPSTFLRRGLTKLRYRVIPTRFVD